MDKDRVVRRALWASVPFNLGGALIFAFPDSFGRLANLPGPVPPLYRASLALLIALSHALGALACVVPDEGNTPWRRAVSKVRYLPETEVWAELMSRDRTMVQYIVSLDEPKRVAGRCYWPVEVRAEGKLWKRFLVTPDGKGLIEEKQR